MKITVIRVNMFEKNSSDAMKPLIFPILDSLTPKEVEIEFFDDRIEILPEKIDSDIIVFSAETFSIKRAYILARKYKKDNNITAIGGFHSTVMPEESALYCDCVLAGDAEDIWGKMIKDYLKGELKKIYISKFNKELGYINYYHRSFDGKKYQPVGVMQFSRGCKFDCDFCSIKSMYKGNVKQKKWDIVEKELKNFKEKIIFFIDDNLLYDRESFFKFLHIIKPLKKRWACQISLDIAFQDDILKEMQESGCFLVLMGFESMNSKNLQQMNKKANLTIKDYDKAVENIYKHGLLIYGTFILGYDYDTLKNVKETIDFSHRHNFAVANFNPLIPMPGTKLYERLKKSNRLLYKKWWLEEEYCYGDTVYSPMGMSPEDLKNLCKDARFEFYSIKNILKRMIRNKLHLSLKNMWIYLLINIVSRREIHKKQGRILGGRWNENNIDKA